MNHAKGEHVAAIDQVDDDVLSDRKATQAYAKIVVARTSQIWVTSQQEKPLGEGVYEPVGDLDAPALNGDVIPDIVEISRSLGR
jgi:hypothetical protein